MSLLELEAVQSWHEDGNYFSDLEIQYYKQGQRSEGQTIFFCLPQTIPPDVQLVQPSSRCHDTEDILHLAGGEVSVADIAVLHDVDNSAWSITEKYFLTLSLDLTEDATLDGGEVVVTEVNVVEVAEPGDLGHLGESLGDEEDSVGLDLLELDLEVKSSPEGGISAELVKSPADPSHAVQVLRQSSRKITLTDFPPL